MMSKQISNHAETVLVTGGTGFIASWCIVELLRRGFAVRATVRSLSKEQAVRSLTSDGLNTMENKMRKK